MVHRIKRLKARFGGPFLSVALVVCFGGFISHHYLDLLAQAGYLVAFNTDARGDVLVPNTRKLDAEIRAFFVAKVGPVLEASRVR